MTKAGFGEHLKREREMRGVSLDEICAATRISTRFLEALESEEWDQLPGGVFNRGFVRAVARFLGLDEDGFVAEYALTQNEVAPPPVWAYQNSKQPEKPRWLPLAGLAAVVVILFGAGLFGWHVHERRRAQRNAAQHALDTAAPAPASAPALGAPNAAAIASASNSPPSATVTNGSAAAAPADPTAAGATATPAAPPASDTLELKIEAGKATKLTVSADGKRVFEGRIIAGQNRTFTAQTNFDVAARDAGAVLLELNGKTLAPIGPPGRPGKVTLTRHDAPASAGGFN
jgi:cytoskeleton protein RodZ